MGNGGQGLPSLLDPPQEFALDVIRGIHGGNHVIGGIRQELYLSTGVELSRHTHLTAKARTIICCTSVVA